MDHDEMLKETYRLTQDNNRMLRSMRRNAFWGGIFRFVIYAALLLVPLWFYYVYLAPIVDDLMKTVAEVQGTGAQAKAQFGSFQEMLKQFQALMSKASN